MKFQCSRCSSNKYWLLGDGRFRCSSCRRSFTDSRQRVRISRSKLREVVQEFLLEHSTNTILTRVDISRYMLLKILTAMRMVMTQDVPEVFEGVVEVDETYVGGQWRNKRKVQRLQGTKRGRGTSKQPVFGILCRNGYVWAEMVPGVESATLLPLINKRVKRGSIVYSDTWRGYTGIAANGYVHRLVDHGKGEFSDTKGTHINGLEGFWGYLKRKLAAKGGIRRERLPLYLGEYVWRYNHRKMNFKEQEKLLMTMLYQNIRSG